MSTVCHLKNLMHGVLLITRNNVLMLIIWFTFLYLDWSFSSSLKWIKNFFEVSVLVVCCFQKKPFNAFFKHILNFLKIVRCNFCKSFNTFSISLYRFANLSQESMKIKQTLKYRKQSTKPSTLSTESFMGTNYASNRNSVMLLTELNK